MNSRYAVARKMPRTTAQRRALRWLAEMASTRPYGVVARGDALEYVDAALLDELVAEGYLFEPDVPE